MGKILYIDEVAPFTREDWDKLVKRVKAGEISYVSWRTHIVTCWPATGGSVLVQYLAEKKQEYIRIVNA